VELRLAGSIEHKSLGGLGGIDGYGIVHATMEAYHVHVLEHFSYNRTCTSMHATKDSFIFQEQVICLFCGLLCDCSILLSCLRTLDCGPQLSFGCCITICLDDSILVLDLIEA
jgi:hypothetical protein